jgi:ubiquinone/menaquinone biosynthesis C-methylase UbiE
MRDGDVAAGYDRLAPDYDRNWLVHLRDTTSRLARSLPERLEGGGPILELGCGTGFGTDLLAGRYPGRAIEACDFSRGMLEIAAASYSRAGATWKQSDMLAFMHEHAEGSSPLVFAAWSIGYADFRAVFRESRRVLCSGGCLAFVVNLADTLAPLRRAFRYCMQAHARELRCLPRFPFPRDGEALRRALLANGFRVDRMEEGTCPIAPPSDADGRKLPWLLKTGTLAGFDSMLPLDRPGPVADTFEKRLASDPQPIRHHFALAVAIRS